MSEPRLTFTVPPDLKERFDKIPWGFRSPVMRRLTEWFCDIHEQHGDLAIGIVLSKEFELTSAIDQVVRKKLGVGDKDGTA